MMKAQLHTYNRMVLAVLQGEGALRNCRYVQRRTHWPIVPEEVRPQIEGEAAFVTLIGEVDRAQRPMAA